VCSSDLMENLSDSDSDYTKINSSKQTEKREKSFGKLGFQVACFFHPYTLGYISKKMQFTEN